MFWWWLLFFPFVFWLWWLSSNKGQVSYKRFGSGEMFDHMAHYYDWMNRVISLGLDMSWRQSAVRHLMSLPPGSCILDVAMGTGDLSLALLKQRGDYHIVGIDPSVEMLRRAEIKLSRYSSSVIFQKGEAEELPFPDGTFSAVMVAFGVRNFRDRKKGLEEMARVMRADAKMLIMELGYPDKDDHRWLSMFARLFITYVVPCLGILFTCSRQEYHYLQSSMRCFPDATTFQRFVQSECGLSVIYYERCLWGLGPYIYVLEKR